MANSESLEYSQSDFSSDSMSIKSSRDHALTMEELESARQAYVLDNPDLFPVEIRVIREKPPRPIPSSDSPQFGLHLVNRWERYLKRT